MSTNEHHQSALLIGLTGGIGSGKSAVSQLFEALSIAVVDTDVIAHQLTAVNGLAMPAIAAHFGSDYQNHDGSLNRTAMRKLVFEHPSQKAALEAIIHPMIESAVLAQIKDSCSPYIVIVVPLLFESPRYRYLVDYTIAIDCPESLQIQRVMQRSGLSEAEVQAIMQHQINREARNRLADFIISNESDRHTLQLAVTALHNELLAKAKIHSSSKSSP